MIRTRRSWSHMLDRCYNPKDISYPNYGRRGISVCDEWHSFNQFLADMGERPPGTSINRIDNDGNYEPGNCNWATHTEQALNSSKTRQVTICGEQFSMRGACDKLGLSRHIVQKYIKKHNVTTIEAILDIIDREDRNRNRDAGIARAMTRTPPSGKEVLEVIKLFQRGIPQVEIARLTGMNRHTIHGIVKLNWWSHRLDPKSTSFDATLTERNTP